MIDNETENAVTRDIIAVMHEAKFIKHEVLAAAKHLAAQIVIADQDVEDGRLH